jgi:hypothetical protein
MLAPVELVREPARPGDLVVGQRGAADRHGAVLGVDRQQGLQPGRVGLGVVVEEGDHLGGDPLDRGVAGRAQPPGEPVREDLDRRTRLVGARTPGGQAALQQLVVVVDAEEDLPGRHRLVLDGGDRPLQQVPAGVGVGADHHVGHRSGALLDRHGLSLVGGARVLGPCDHLRRRRRTGPKASSE